MSRRTGLDRRQRFDLKNLKLPKKKEMKKHPLLMSRKGKTLKARVRKGVNKPICSSRVLWECSQNVPAPHLLPGRFCNVWKATRTQTRNPQTGSPVWSCSNFRRQPQPSQYMFMLECILLPPPRRLCGSLCLFVCLTFRKINQTDFDEMLQMQGLHFGDVLDSRGTLAFALALIS